MTTDSYQFHDYPSDIIHGYTHKIISLTISDARKSFTSTFMFDELQEVSIKDILLAKRIDCNILSVEELDNKKHYNVIFDSKLACIHTYVI